MAKNGVYELVVHDRSIGLPMDIDVEKSETLGLQLVWILTEQIDGIVEVTRKDGACFRISFPVIKKI